MSERFQGLISNLGIKFNSNWIEYFNFGISLALALGKKPFLPQTRQTKTDEKS